MIDDTINATNSNEFFTGCIRAVLGKIDSYDK